MGRYLDDEEGATLQQLQGHSITYRIAMGPQAGRKVLTACAARYKQFEAWEEDDYGTGQLGKVGGFSLHAGVAVNTRERKKLERICRYISRPALSAETIRADRSGHGQLCLENSVPARPDRDGTTHVVFERGGLPPLDFMAKLAALVPKPRTNLTRFHGVLAPNSRYRESVTPLSARQVKPATADVEADGPDEPDLGAGRRKRLCCTEGRPAKRLKRVFNRAAQV